MPSDYKDNLGDMTFIDNMDKLFDETPPEVPFEPPDGDYICELKCKRSELLSKDGTKRPLKKFDWQLRIIDPPTFQEDKDSRPVTLRGRMLFRSDILDIEPRPNDKGEVTDKEITDARESLKKRFAYFKGQLRQIDAPDREPGETLDEYLDRLSTVFKGDVVKVTKRVRKPWTNDKGEKVEGGYNLFMKRREGNLTDGSYVETPFDADIPF